MNAALQDNEILRANVSEADYWVYDRGIVAEELYDLRLSSSTKDREIDRLTRENEQLRRSLRRAEAIVADAGRKHPRHPVGHPPSNQMSFNQANIDELFNRCSSARRTQPQDI